VQTGAREPMTSESHVIITEKWWGDYTIRAFNICKVGLPSLIDVTEEEVRAAFQIYVPEASHNHICDNGVCTLCGVDTVTASLDRNVLTLTGTFAEGTRILTVSYGADGRFAGSRFLTWQGKPITEEIPAGENVKLFFADENWSPLRQFIALR